MPTRKGNTHKITDVKPDILIKILKKFGFKIKQPRNRGSHIKMTKAGISRPIIVVNHGGKEIRSFDVKSTLKSAGISEKDYLDEFNRL